MIDGNPKEFIDNLYFGEEMYFIFRGIKFFIEGINFEGKKSITMYAYDPAIDELDWEWPSKDNKNFPVEDFEKSKIFGGKSFWEVEKEIQWIDY